LLTTLRMQEEQPDSIAGASSETSGTSIIQAFKLTLQAGRWILQTPFALVIILVGLLFDNCLRMQITLISQYYRLIDLPEASFGLISSGFALLGFVVPLLAHRMVKHHTPLFNLAVMAVFTLLGLIGMTFFWPLIIGLVPVVLTRVVMYLLYFFQSHYLNRITSSHQRATVLSFKGLSFNLAYGLVGILYSLLLAFLRSRMVAGQPDLSGEILENLVFKASYTWFPWYFIVTMVAVILFTRRRLRDSNEHKISG